MASVAVPALKYLTVPPVTKHTATIIFLHGLGDTGHGWEPVAHMLRPALPQVKWVLPHAPQRKITVNFGMSMPGWFDIAHLGDRELFEKTEDETGFRESSRSVQKLITEEIDAGIDPSRIILGGFSQGGALTLYSGLTEERKLGGLVVLSGWLPLRSKFKSMLSAHAPSAPIFFGRGSADPLIPSEVSEMSKDFLLKDVHVKDLTYKTYSGLGHSTDERELKDLKEWLQKVLPEA
ncbi:Phospholipase/carboxylesterase/thioesterase [Gymnopilus junonius]|uniref:Acyl-protein thioesterase 1 n=1 Tax=Gymnopilus junonius TaxID=109634 RepID=A0A9P5NEJ5_GYMJU|nr:Phospholipase/carboxylesterase/thioesterase [Gymnopilus junonius]